VTFLRSRGVDEWLSIVLTGWDRLHDLLGLVLVVDLEREQVLGSSKLELGRGRLLVLLNGDLVSLGQVLLVSSHDLDEFLQVLDFLWLHTESIHTKLPTICSSTD